MNTHNAVITRNTPSAFIYLLDISGSMAENIVYESEKMTKNDALNKIVNTTLHETVLGCKGYDGVKDYFDIAILGYHKNRVINLLEPFTGKEGFCNINDIVNSKINTKTYNYIRTKEDGTTFISQRSITQYIKTEPYGTTPMYKALENAHSLLQKWIIEHKGRKCFPPILINITDGEMSDATNSEMIMISQRIKRLSTENGAVIFFNIHLSSQVNAESIAFPTTSDSLPDIRNIKLMHEMSSELPESFHDALIWEMPWFKKENLKHAKTMCYNTPVNSLTKILKIGSASRSFVK